MVDLVKIRKKAKKKAAEAGNESAAPARSEVKAAKAAPTRANEAVSQAPEKVEAPARDQAAPAESAAPAPEESKGRPASQATPVQGSSKLDRFKEEAGRRREELAFATGEQDETGDERLELLTFVIAGEQYAADIERIIEIVTPRAVTRVPNAEQPIVGILSLRGTIVTLLDVRTRLRHRASEQTPETRIIVLDHNGETVGFEVDRVLRVVKLSADSVEPHPIVHASETDESIRGVFRHNDALTILLDLDKLLEGGRIGGAPVANERIARRA